jgi:hypothetical protein
MKSLTFVIASAFILLLTGCPKNQGRMPEVLVQRIINYEVKTFDDNLKAYNQTPDPGTRRIIRDEIIFRLKRNIDAFYHDFEDDLFYRRAKMNVFADFAELALAGATGITNGERAKDILAISLTAFKGGRKSFDEHFFRERTTEILISKMRASRAQIETEITKSLAADVHAYSLDMAMGDLIKYFYAGTVQNALQELAQQTGKEATEARQNADREAERRISTEIQAEFNDSVRLRQALRQLQSDIDSGDQTKVNAAQTRLRSALTKLKDKLKVTFSDSDPPKNLLDILLAGLRKAHGAEGAIFKGDLKLKEVVEALQ